jgi:hypothetical protein
MLTLHNSDKKTKGTSPATRVVYKIGKGWKCAPFSEGKRQWLAIATLASLSPLAVPQGIWL